MNNQSTEEIDEQLTAYLDGELSSEESALVESRLVTDERLRLRLAEMRRAYDLLDELPETPHDQRFTRSTLELVVKDLQDNPPASTTAGPIIASPRFQWWEWPGFGVLLFMLILCGASMGLGVRWMRTQQELSELSMVACLPGLIDAQELSVAMELSKEKDVIELLKDSYSERLLPSIPRELSKRTAWINSLSPTQVAKLDTGREMLRKINSDTYKRIDAIRKQIDERSDDEAALIQDTYQVIGFVLDSLPNSRRLEMESMKQDQRVKFLREQMAHKAAIVYANQMPDEDRKAIELWSHEYLLPALIEAQPFTRRANNLDIIDRLEILWARRPLEDGYQLDNQQEMIAALLPTLTETGRSLLSQINRNYQLGIISSWLSPKQISSIQKLIDAYEKINPDKRDAIDLVDPQKSKRDLEAESLRRSMQRGNRQ